MGWADISKCIKLSKWVGCGDFKTLKGRWGGGGGLTFKERYGG